MMSEISKLVAEIRSEAIGGEKSVLPLLRKCQVLASLLRNVDLKQWVSRELNGYKSVDDLPKYRIVKVQNIGNFSGMFGRSLQNAPIPVAILGEKLAKALGRSCFVNGVGTIEGLLSGNMNDRLAEVWPADFIANHASEFYENYNLLQAYKLISRSDVIGLLEAIRNKVLEFVLELQEELPDLREEAISEEDNKSVVQRIVNTYIYGDGNRIATNCHDVDQSIMLQVGKGNWDMLSATLTELKVSKSDQMDLKKAIESEPPQGPQKLGGRVSAWLGRVLAKVGTASAAELIVKGIGYYCGF